MKKLIGLSLIILALTGCATSIPPKCRHYAIFNALVASEKYPVRIILGNTRHDEKIWHAQAEALIDNEWKPLRCAPVEVVTSRADNFVPQNILTLREALERIVIIPKRFGK
jgi:hypothetical protein